MFPASITCRDSLSGTTNGDWGQPRIKKALERQGCMGVNSPWDKGSKRRQDIGMHILCPMLSEKLVRPSRCGESLP